MNVCDTGAAIVNTFQLIRNTYNENDALIPKQIKAVCIKPLSTLSKHVPLGQHVINELYKLL